MEAMRRAWRVGICVAGLSLGACQHAQPPAKVGSPAPLALHRGPITDFVPAAGLRWMLVARPNELLQNATLRRALDKLFPPERLNVFAQQSGLDIRSLGVACVAGFDLGTLYLAETMATGKVEKAFLARLASEPVTKHPGPGVTHITGLIGLTPESFVNVEGRLVAVSVKDPTLTRIVGAFALERLKKSPSALAGAALRDLPKSFAVDPLQFYAPGPFNDEWAAGANGLLADSTAVGISAHLTETGERTAVDVQVMLRGEYGANSKQTVERAVVSFQDLAQSGLGRLFALNDVTISPDISATPHEVTLRVQLPLLRLLEGLHAAVAANVSELFDYGPGR
jgi:hypothetical protein